MILTFYELNKHTSPEQVAGYLAPLAKGETRRRDLGGGLSG